VRIERLRVFTGSRPVVKDLTAQCSRFANGLGDGLLSVFVPHATAGVALIETGSGSEEDLLALIDSLAPPDAPWRHRHGSPGHGRSHVLPALVSPSVVVPVMGGQMALGTWQSICLVDTNVDNPEREVILSFLGG
jgi:secondary thiamine-phosphate synthase enzyme